MKNIHYILTFVMLIANSEQLLFSLNQKDIELPLHALILNQNYSVEDKVNKIKQILEQKIVDINARDANGRTALNLATYYKADPEIINALVEDKNIEINEPDYYNVTPLHNAVRFDECQAIAILSSHHADFTFKDGDNKTPSDLLKSSSCSINR